MSNSCDSTNTASTFLHKIKIYKGDKKINSQGQLMILYLNYYIQSFTQTLYEIGINISKLKKSAQETIDNNKRNLFHYMLSTMTNITLLMYLFLQRC